MYPLLAIYCLVRLEKIRLNPGSRLELLIFWAIFLHVIGALFCNRIMEASSKLLIPINEIYYLVENGPESHKFWRKIAQKI